MENKLQPNEYKVMSLISERLEIGRKRYGGDIPLNGEKHILFWSNVEKMSTFHKSEIS